jgi:hypothetical protein
MSAYDYLLAQGFAAAIILTGSRSSTRTTDS